MCRICIAEVCVRSSVSGWAGASAPACPPPKPRRRRRRPSERLARYSVSCMSRAGCSGRHVERFEVVVVVLDLGAFEHLVAEPREDLAAPRRERGSADGGSRARGARPGSVTSTAPAGRRVAASAASRSASAASTSRFSSLAPLAERSSSRRAARSASASMKAATQLPVAPDPAGAQRLEVAVGTHLGQLVAKELGARSGP